MLANKNTAGNHQLRLTLYLWWRWPSRCYWITSLIDIWANQDSVKIIHADWHHYPNSTLTYLYLDVWWKYVSMDLNCDVSMYIYDINFVICLPNAPYGLLIVRLWWKLAAHFIHYHHCQPFSGDQLLATLWISTLHVLLSLTASFTSAMVILVTSFIVSSHGVLGQPLLFLLCFRVSYTLVTWHFIHK